MSKAEFSSFLTVAVVLAAALSDVPAVSAQAGIMSKTGATIRGVVTSSNGQAMEGVVISARSSDATFTTSVFSDRQGRYYFPLLGAGQYKIWAQAVGFEAAKAELALKGSGQIDQNLTLAPNKDVRQTVKQLSGTELLLSMPGATLEDARGKRLFANNCTGCHTASWPLQNRWDEQGWGNFIDLMAVYPSHGNIPTPAMVEDTAVGLPMMRAYRDELAQYLGRARGAAELSDLKLLPRPTGEATQVVITEFDFPRTDNNRLAKIHDGSDWSLGTPTRHVGRAAHDIWIAPDGNIWVADDQVPLRTTAKLDPRTGKVTDYYLKDEHGNSYHTHSVWGDSKGNVWLQSRPDENFLLFDPKTEKFTRFPRPQGMAVVGGTISVDSKGTPWAVSNSGAVKLDPATGKYTFYPSPTKGGGYGVIVDRKDNAWHTQPGIEAIVKVDAVTGKSSEVVFEQLKRPEVTPVDWERGAKLRANQNSAPPQQQAPRRMSADPNSDYVWVSLYTGNRIARVDTATLQKKEWELPHDFSQPYANTTDKNGNVWINAMNLDRIVKFDPKTEKFTEYKMPTLGSEIRHIVADDSTNPPTIWAPYNRSNKIVRLQFRTGTEQAQVR